jgi:hypothetical protein
LNLEKKYVSYFKKENIDIKKTIKQKNNKYKKKEQDNVGVHGFIVLLFFFKTVITLKLKPQMKLCSCPLESIYCLKKCPGAHSTLDKCYYRVPSTSHNFCRIC